MADDTRKWFIYRGTNLREGSYTPKDLRDSARKGILQPDDLLWREGMLTMLEEDDVEWVR